MLIVGLSSDNDKIIEVAFNYSSDYISRIKKLSTSRFVDDEVQGKKWLFDKDEFLIFEQLFKGEIIYRTARHKILNIAPPPLPDHYKKIDNKKIKGLNVELYPFQQFGANFLIYDLKTEGFGLICDTMGLGKTYQSIAAVKALKDEGLVTKTLIVCLANLKQQWADEGIKALIGEDSLIIQGDPKKRAALYQQIPNHTFIIINYDLVLRDQDILKDIQFDCVIFDEVHKLKNTTGKTHKAAKRLKAPYKVGLSGTPLMNTPEELFGVYNALLPGYLGTHKHFSSKYIRTRFNGRYVDLIGYQNLDELREIISPTFIRRTEDEVAMDLPESIHITRYVPMSDLQLEISEDIKNNIASSQDKIQNFKTQGKEIEEIEQIKGYIQGEYTLLIGCADTPELFTMSESYMVRKRYADKSKDIRTSPKIEETMELLEEILSNNEKVVIFTQFQRMTLLLEREIAKRFKVPVLLYHGQMSQSEKTEATENFRKKNKYKILISTDAGSTGLNLQVAKYLIHFDLRWNPSIMKQREGRIKRLGSTHDTVKIITLVSENSIDEAILRSIENKTNLFSMLIENSDEESEYLKGVSNEEGDE